MTRQELIDRAHGQARDKGFWDKRTGSPEDVSELLMLIISECGEAVEADRKKRRANMEAFDITMKKGECAPGASFEAFVKDTVEDELADVVIRIADMMGGLGIPPLLGAGAFPRIYGLLRSESFCVRVFECVSGLFQVGPVNRSLAIQLQGCLTGICTLAYDFNIDIERHVLLKLDYNLTREKLHGKSY